MKERNLLNAMFVIYDRRQLKGHFWSVAKVALIFGCADQKSWLVSNKYLCTLSAKDRGTTKNSAVDLELILMHHFSRIFHLDFSSVLSKKALSFTSRISKITQNMVTKNDKTRHLCASISAHSLNTVKLGIKKKLGLRNFLLITTNPFIP